MALRPHRVTGPVMAAFLDAAAVQPVAAIAYRPTAVADGEFRRLVKNGVLRAHGPGYWFDLRRHYAVEHAAAARRAVVGVVLALTTAAIAVLFYRG